MTRPVQDMPSTSSGSRSGAGVEPSARRYITTTVGNYEMIKVLGKGNFAKVVEATHNILQIKVAIKIIDTSRITQEYVIKNLAREAKLLSKLEHPNIVRLYETIQNGPVYYLVTELATGGDLCSHVKNQASGKLDENQARSYARQLTAALKHMHSRDIVHRDLKMENIMLQDERKEILKIVDFGLSNQFNDENPLKTQCGSPEYAAPELFVKGKRYGPEVDLWSLGVILYVMGSGRLPFLSPRDGQTTSDERRRRLLAQINRGLTEVQERTIVNLTPEFKNLVGRLLTPAPQKRINMTELVQHPWLSKRSCLKSASFRISSTDIRPTDHNLIMNELDCMVNSSRREIEMEIGSKRYSKLGGMYNILAHEIQRNPNYKFKSRTLTRNRSFRRNVTKTYSNSNQRSMNNGVHLTPSKIKMNSAYLISEKELFNKNGVHRGVSYQCNLLRKDSSGGVDSLEFKKMSNHNINKSDEKPVWNRNQKPTPKAPMAVTSYPKCTFQPYSQMNHTVTNLSKSGINHKEEKYSQPANSSHIPKILQNDQSRKYSHSLHQSMSLQAQNSGKSSEAAEAHKNDRLLNREKFFGTSRSKPDAGKKPSFYGRPDKLFKTRDNVTEVVSKPKPVKESGSNRGFLKKPRNVMKTLDKFKWTNCIFQPNKLEDEFEKNLKSKMETFRKSNDDFPEILKNYTKSKYVVADKFN